MRDADNAHTKYVLLFLAIIFSDFILFFVHSTEKK